MLAFSPFWREKPFTPQEAALFEAVCAAHRASAVRNNCSTAAVKNAAAGSRRLETALASGLLALGGAHAPIVEIYHYLGNIVEFFDEDVRDRLIWDKKVPGWGNSFFKGRRDPDWAEVEALIAAHPIYQKIEEVSSALRQAEKRLFPNAGCFTAAAAIVLGIPAPLSPYLLIHARLPVWAALAAEGL